MAAQLDTLIFDARPCGFPKPRVPLLPTGLDGITLAPTPRRAPAENFRHFTRGRYALREAYRLAGISPGGTLLAPAYHCRTMIDPALALDGRVILYPLRPDLSIDVTTLDALADRSPTPIKALLATHFFGIPQELGHIAAWCAERSITLIEDCSHVMFGEHHRPPDVGTFGEFVVSSPYKFLPSPDGGLLYCRHAHRLDEVQTHAPSWSAELRGIAYAVSKAGDRRHGIAACDPTSIDTELAGIMKHPAPAARDIRENAGCSADYRPDDEGREALRCSRLLYRHPGIAEVARRRRDNYRRWIDATSGLPDCRPLFSNLPEGCIPYMFPLVIEQPELHFCRLKQLGVPIWRWDSIVASACPVANSYRLRLLHLPCHQSLNDRQIDWMISAVEKVSRGNTPGVEA